jgi:hypothetical protein
VEGHPLFKLSRANCYEGTAYRALNKITWESGDKASGWLDMVQFRDALEELRNDNLNMANWGLLSSRGRINLSPDEIASSDQALRLYSTNADSTTTGSGIAACQ